MENTNPNIARVQHVAKSSSDQLLSKFAELDSDSKHTSCSAKDLRVTKKRVKNKISGNNNVLAEKKSLLPSATVRKPGALIRTLGKMSSKAKKNKSILIAIDKTWRRTVEGASRVLMEKHYNRHKRLISDVY